MHSKESHFLQIFTYQYYAVYDNKVSSASPGIIEKLIFKCHMLL